MVSYYQNEGVNTFYVIGIDTSVMSSYETDMLYNNFIDGLIQPEFRAINGEMMIYNKVNGLQSLDKYMRESGISREESVSLLRSVCSAVKETGEYMLSPDSIVMDADKVFRENGGEYRFMYVPGYRKDIRGQIKRLVEDMMKKINHSDRGLADFWYDVYDIMTSENYDISDVIAFIDKCRANERRKDDIGENSRSLNSDLLDEVFGDSESPSCEEKGKGICAMLTAGMLMAACAGALLLCYEFISYGQIMHPKMFMLFTVAIIVMVFVYLDLKGKDLKDDMREDTDCNEKACEELPCTDIQKEKKVVTDETRLLTDMGDETTLLSADREDSETTIVVELSGESSRYCLKVDGCGKVLGRDGEEADMVVADRSVSRRHAVLHGRDGQVYIEDLDSTNGTFVNDIRLPVKRQWQIKSGDIVRLGNTGYQINISVGTV